MTTDRIDVPGEVWGRSSGVATRRIVSGDKGFVGSSVRAVALLKVHPIMIKSRPGQQIYREGSRAKKRRSAGLTLVRLCVP
jgi:hypothetical protein